MDVNKIISLRPADRSVRAIVTAMEQIAAERTSLAAKVAELEAGRGAMLLSGSKQQLDAAEHALTSVRQDGEGLEALAAVLLPQLEAAREAEQQDGLQGLADEADRASAAFQAAWPGYAEAAERIRSILILESTAQAAYARYNHRKLAMNRQLAEQQFKTAQAAGTATASVGIGVNEDFGVRAPTHPLADLPGQFRGSALADLVQLPGMNGAPFNVAGGLPYWWDGKDCRPTDEQVADAAVRRDAELAADRERAAWLAAAGPGKNTVYTNHDPASRQPYELMPQSLLYPPNVQEEATP